MGWARISSLLSASDSDSTRVRGSEPRSRQAVWHSTERRKSDLHQPVLAVSPIPQRTSAGSQFCRQNLRKQRQSADWRALQNASISQASFSSEAVSFLCGCPPLLELSSESGTLLTSSCERIRGGETFLSEPQRAEASRPESALPQRHWVTDGQVRSQPKRSSENEVYKGIENALHSRDPVDFVDDGI